VQLQRRPPHVDSFAHKGLNDALSISFNLLTTTWDVCLSQQSSDARRSPTLERLFTYNTIAAITVESSEAHNLSPIKQAEACYDVNHSSRVGYLGNDVHPIKLYGDGQPSLQLVASEGHHERTKHVDIYYHYIKDQVNDGQLLLEHVGTKDIAADGLTKPLDEIAHGRFLQQVGLRKPWISIPSPAK
jgi:hypothetical protein